jgi:aryl carrier-like protein
MKMVQEGLDSNELIVYDGRWKEEEKIIKFIEKRVEAGTAVLIDYMQEIPGKKKKTVIGKCRE